MIVIHPVRLICRKGLFSPSFPFSSFSSFHYLITLLPLSSNFSLLHIPHFPLPPLLRYFFPHLIFLSSSFLFHYFLILFFSSFSSSYYLIPFLSSSAPPSFFHHLLVLLIFLFLCDVNLVQSIIPNRNDATLPLDCHKNKQGVML